MGANFQIAPLLRGLLGGTVGGTIGYFVFAWILGQGFYAMVLPGAALGLGFGASTRERSTVYGIVSAVLAVGLGLFTEWRFFPFVKDGSLAYFLTHIHDLRPLSLIMIAIGGVCGYWFGVGRAAERGENDAGGGAP